MASRTLFIESESGDDSVATDTTVESEQLDEYAVEKVLLEERHHEDNEMRYLIKWEGYPLSAATWEPLSNIEDRSIIEQWEEQKAAIAQGLAEPFDPDEFTHAVTVACAQRDDRLKRREAKRAKRRAQSSNPKPAPKSRKNNTSDGEDSLSTQFTKEKASPDRALERPRKATKPTTTPIRKGQARVVARRLAISSDGSNYSESEDEALNEDVLEEQYEQQPAVVVRSAPRKTAPTANMMPASNAAGTTSSRKVSETRVNPTTRPDLTLGRTTSSAEITQNKTSNLRESVPRKQRPRVSGDTPKQSTEAQFRKLSQMGRYQKYGAQNEPPPDIRKLVLLDPKTGKPETAPPAPSTAQQVTSQASSNVYNRRSPPPKPGRRSPSPVPRARNASDAASRPVTATSATALPKSAYVKTCPEWAAGRCPNDAITCTRAHHWADPQILGAKNIACHFWRTAGKCYRTDQECAFAHHDTGYYGRPPGAHDRSQLKLHAAPTGPRGFHRVPREETTCFYWKDGGECFNPNCRFAHRDTGYYTKKPGTIREVPVGDRSLDDRHMSLPNTIANHSRRSSPDSYRECGSRAGTRDPITDNARTGTSRLDGIDDERSPIVNASVPSKHPDVDGSRRDMASEANASQSGNRSGTMARKSSNSIATDSRPRRASSVSLQLLKATIHITLEGASEDVELNVHLEASDHALPSSSATILEVQHAIMASDFQSIVWTKGTKIAEQSSGRVIADADHATSAQSVAELCKSTTSGLIAKVNSGMLKMLIYPSTAEEWKFLPPVESRPGSTDSAILSFCLFTQMPGFEDHLAANLTQFQNRSFRSVEGVGAAIVDLDADRLLLKEHDKRIEAVFLMLPASRHIEFELFSRFFIEQGCKIYHSGTAGAWLYFVKKYRRSCLVIIHPEVRLDSIPRLYDLIAQHGAGPRFFSVGVNRDAAAVLHERPSFGCVRLFPNGQVIYLTDEALQYHPNESRDIITFIKRDNERPLSHSKIVTRPNVKAWLLDLIASTQDSRYVELYTALCFFCPAEDHNPDDMTKTLPTSSLLMIDASTMPRLASMDDTARSDYLINWFAGWAMLHASVWRMFVICYEPKEGSTRMVPAKTTGFVVEANADPFGWAKRYQHVGVVGPKQLQERLAKKQESSLLQSVVGEIKRKM